jgi:hypothetical protein
MALFACGGVQSTAYRLAGFGGKNDSLSGPASKSVRVNSTRLFADPRVRAAIREYAITQIDVSEPEVMHTVMSIMRDANERGADRLRAAAMIWEWRWSRTRRRSPDAVCDRLCRSSGRSLRSVESGRQSALMAVTVLELKEHHCRWPSGEGINTVYCGAERVKRKPYCSNHCAIAYRTPREPNDSASQPLNSSPGLPRPQRWKQTVGKYVKSMA